MREFGFPPQAAAARVNSVAAELRRRAETAQVETVTGRHVDPAKALDGKTGELFLIQKSLGDAQDRGRNLALAASRADTMQTALQGMRDQMELLLPSITTVLEFGTQPMRDTAATQASQSLDAIASALNVRFGDRALFAGDAGDRAAFARSDAVLADSLAVLNAAGDAVTAYADLTAAFDGAGGLYETQFYLGGTGEAPDVEIAEGERVAYGVRADDPAVRDLVRNVAVLALALDQDSGLAAPLRDELARLALGGLRNNVADMATVQSRLGVAEARISAATARNQAAETSLTISYNELAGRDQFEAAEELKALETQLETAYVTTARLSNLNLASYLG